jgi:hypothetical protein
MAWSKTIDFYTLSWDVPRMPHEMWSKQHNGKVTLLQSMILAYVVISGNK